MKNFLSTLKLLTAVTVMGTSSSAWSAVQTENPLGDSYWAQTHSPRIDMTDISFKYKGGNFAGVSGNTSTFTMVRPDLSTFTFTGKLKIAGTYSQSTGITNGAFAFTSTDSKFNFGNYCLGAICTPKIGNVFSGKLSSMGWSDSNGFIEFGTSNFSGWACNMGWCTAAERLRLNKPGSLGLPGAINGGQLFSTQFKTGTAVIPVPATAWLLGSGLIGLAGIARRKAVK